MDNKISQLKEMLDQSKYTVALCGSGMMEEGNALAAAAAIFSTLSKSLTEFLLQDPQGAEEDDED